jgi:hypothetical protein
VLSHVEGQQIHAFHPEFGDYTLHYEGAAQPLFTENESNAARLWGEPNATPYVKDAFHEFVIGGRKEAVNPALSGTKGAAHYRIDVPAGGSRVVRLRLSQASASQPFATFDTILAQRQHEADEFYDRITTGIAQRRRAPHPSSSARRDVVVEAVLLLRSRHVARGSTMRTRCLGCVTTCGTPSGSTC